MAARRGLIFAGQFLARLQAMAELTQMAGEPIGTLSQQMAKGARL